MPRLIDLISEQNHMNRFSRTPGPYTDTNTFTNTACFVIDNVADYYYHHEREYWCFRDFPFPYPPFKHIWAEYKFPKEIRSKEKGITSLHLDRYEGYFGCFIDEIKPDLWEISFGCYYRDKYDDQLKSPGIKTARFPLTPTSECVDEVRALVTEPGDQPTQENVINHMYMTHPVFMAFSLMACRNVEIIKVEVPAKLNKARASRHKNPLRDFHMVNVMPMTQHKKTMRTISLGQNLGQAVGDIHLRRGSFAVYKDEDGHRLFGKYIGRYWRPAIQKAQAKYEVKVHG